MQAVKKFRIKQGITPQKERSVSLNGAPAEELDWDYHDGTVQVPVTRLKETAPDVVLGVPKEVNRQDRGDNSFRGRDNTMRRKKFTSLKPYKEVVKRQIKQGQKVATLPWPTSPKIYKRKIGDPSGKLYSDEAIYRDEKDDMFAKGMPNSDELDLFDTICEWCKGDHLVIYCPYKQEGSPIRRPTPSKGTKTWPTVCWNCKGPHYYRDCPEKEWHGKLEKARDQSDDLHMQLLINSGGYDRLNKLNEQQRQEIRDSRPKPREETSTRSPYREVDPKKRKVEQESSPFKRPIDGVSPPRRVSRQKERVNEWVREQ